MTETRLGPADLMKGLAVIFMIQVHLMELFARADIRSGMWGGISLFLGGPFAAPVFLSIMGWFLAESKRSALELVKRGLLLVVLGFILNIGLNANLLYKIYAGRLQTEDPYQYVFGVDILFCAGLSILVTALVRKVFRSLPEAYIVLSALAALSGSMFAETAVEGPGLRYLMAFFFGPYHWSYFPLFPWAAYPLAGSAAALLYKKHSLSLISEGARALVLTALGGGAAMVFGLWAYGVTVTLNEYYHHGVGYYLWCLMFLVAWSGLLSSLESDLRESGLARYLRWIGKNVTIIYVCQWLIIGNLATELYRTQSLTECVLWFLAVLLVSSLGAYLYDKVRQVRSGINKKPGSMAADEPYVTGC